MRRRVLLDTRPLIAFLKPQDQFHQWIIAELADIAKALLTCEAVITCPELGCASEQEW